MGKSISFCTTCRNRLWQVKDTLEENLKAIDQTHEIVLVNYGSTDGLSDWVWDNFENQIESGLLKYFEVDGAAVWNVARAKNLAHRLAGGDYLFNLDADNHIRKFDIEKITEASSLKLHCHQWSKNWEDGSFGRIGMPKVVFDKIGGYDETLLAMGGQDIDILNRLHVFENGRRANLGAPAVPAISNTIEDKVAEVQVKHLENKDSSEVYKQLNKINLAISKFKLHFDGPERTGGGFTYKGLLNGKRITINGFDEIQFDTE